MPHWFKTQKRSRLVPLLFLACLPRLPVATLAVEVVGGVVEDERLQVLVAAAHGFAVLEEEERLVGDTARVLLFEGRIDCAVCDGDGEEAKTLSA